MAAVSWTIFGMGNMVWDIYDAIISRDGVVRQLVLNMEAPPGLLEKVPAGIEVIALDDFQPATSNYCFGFVDSAKQELLTRLEPFGIDFANVIHRFSDVSPLASLGRGNFVGAGVVLAPYADLGDFNYLSRCASVGHDSIIGDYNHLGPGATIAGRTRVGDRDFLGAGSVIIDGLEIGDDIILGAGATAIRDLSEPGAYVGTPARRLEK